MFRSINKFKFNFLLKQKCNTNRTFLTFPENEPATNFKLGTHSRKCIQEEYNNMKSLTKIIPNIINGKETFSSDVGYQLMPTDHKTKLAEFYEADRDQILQAIEGSLKAQKTWSQMPIFERSKIFLKAADLIRTKYRYQMMAATMLGQGKNFQQADIDSIGELIDFLEFNCFYGQELKNFQKLHQPKGQINSLEYRPLEGFVTAVSPFNFTAIGGNLSSTPAIMGNVVIWKPSVNALLSSYLYYNILMESGLPEGVIQFINSSRQNYTDLVIQHNDLSAISFTGSTATFQTLWKKVAENIENYKSFPKLIGECGGKNFHFVHSSSNVEHVVNSTIRSSFEYNGQKCSACSRIYLPESRWEEYKAAFIELYKEIKMGQPDDHKVLVTAVINQTSFEKIQSYIDYAKKHHELIAGGKCDDTQGYFIEPTIFKINDLNDKMLKEEIFGPVLSIYTYKDDDWMEILKHIDETSVYALTGSVFSNEKNVIDYANDVLKNCCGNFYINDKSTGSVVAQQPFGGSRKSGTNDKAGMYSFLLKFTSPRSTKESFRELKSFKYEYMNE